MRKAFVLILSLIIISISFSFAEAKSISKDAFTIHNGTKFGMSSVEVRSIEEGLGVSLTEIDSRWENDSVTSFFTQPRIPLAGRDEGEVCYVFNDDSLSYVSYWFNTDNMTSNEIVDDYFELVEAFMNKYGIPDYDSTAGTSSKLPKEYYCQTTQMIQLPEKSDIYTPLDYRQWEIDCGDGSGILIDLYLYASNTSFTKFVSEGVYYTWFDSSVYSSTMEAEVLRQNQMISDI